MESFSPAQKSFKLSFILTGALLLISATGCETAPKKIKENPKEPPSFVLPDVTWNTPTITKRTSPLKPIATGDFKALIQSGDSIHPQFNKDGNRLFFSSGKRSRHKNFEVYYLDLLNSKQKRVTHQQSDALASDHHPHRDLVLYSTSNEELIRNPDKIFAKLKEPQAPKTKLGPGLHFNLGPTDIYSHDLSRSYRDELTKTNGTDLWASYTANGRRVAFTSNRKGSANVYSMNLKGRQFRSVVVSPAQDLQLRVSPDQKQMVWVRRPIGIAGSALLIANSNGKNQKVLELPEGDHIYPAWHRSGEWILFSSDLADGKNFSLFAIHVSGDCLTRLTSDDVHALFPTSHPVDDHIVYAKLDYGQWVIGSREIPLPKTCLKEAP